MRRETALGALALAALIALTLWPLLGADFVYWDDHALFLDDADVRGAHLWRLLTDLGRGGFFPLTRLSLALDHLAFGTDAAVEHLINLVLHFANVGLVYVVVRRQFLLNQVSAAVAAAVFAVHPINVEAVAWVSGGRKDLLCALLYLAAVAALTTGRTVAAGLASLLAKAMAVTLAPWLWLTGRRQAARWLAPVTLAVAALEWTAQRTALRIADAGDTPTEALGRALTGLTLSVSRVLWPRDLAVFYDRAVVHVDWGDVALVTTLALLLVAGRRDPRRRLALGWFALLILPTLKLVPFGQDSVFNDRYLYLPGVGLIAFVVMSVERAWARDRRRAWAALLPLGALGVLAHAQARTWVSQETLWLNVDRRHPTSRKVAANLSLYYVNENRLGEAEAYARRAVADEPTNPEARSNLGVLLTRLGRLDEARDVYLDAGRLAPRDPVLLNNLGYVFLELREFASAKETFARALEVAPDFANAREGLRRARDGAP